MDAAIILSSTGLLLSILSIILFYKSKKIRIEKTESQKKRLEQAQQEINKLYDQKKDITQHLLNYQIEESNKIDIDLQKKKNLKSKQIEDQFQEQQKKLDLILQIQKKQNQQKIAEIDKDFDLYKEKKQQEQLKIEENIQSLKNTLAAGIQATARKNEDINFYKLSISDTDLSDVEKLEKLKKELHKPIILSKLIWTQYFQKQTTALCDRILGKEKVCGIYKITDLITKQCYIGQSVDVAERWKNHCKCGLGIDASSTSKLYNTMQKDGIWNFTFELLEKCSREKLNEKESFWIDAYQSNIYGLNTLKGNKYEI